MNELARKKSPRAPSIALQQAIEGAIKIYEKERRHAAPVEAVAQHLGYKNANNGAAVKALASIRYFGLLERPSDGMLAVAKDIETYQFAPNPSLRQDLIRRWLKAPQLFADLLEKYKDGLPSDANLRFEFSQRGFLPDGVESAVSVFRNSVEFARYFELRPDPIENEGRPAPQEVEPEPRSPQVAEPEPQQREADSKSDRIPIRLPGGRRAWLEVPTPFYAADKERIKRQVDLLLTQEDEDFRE